MHFIDFGNSRLRSKTKGEFNGWSQILSHLAIFKQQYEVEVGN